MNIRRKQIERITITGMSGESEKAIDYCTQHGYCVIRVGPRRVNAVQVDPSRFKIVAEREFRSRGMVE